MGAYDKIERKLSNAQEYLSSWLQYQSLWDLSSESVYNRIDEDLLKWQQLLVEIKNARDTFDTSETARSFGPIVIDYEQVQFKVNAKYDSWQREILNKYGHKLGGRMKEYCSHVMSSRRELEKQNLDNSTTREAVAFVIFVQELNKKVDGWKEEVSTYVTGEKLLEKQRFQFPSDWLYAEQITGEWGAFFDILGRKNKSIHDHMSKLNNCAIN
jgi:dynein heavy chain 1